ncbi:MAG: hypothetical protein WBL93_00515 [Lutisporaceae bacterium]
MKNFLIGQHGEFDQSKQNRDFRQGFFGVEACLLKSEEDIKRLQSEALEHKFQIAVHFPLRAGRSKLRDALFMSLDKDIREGAFLLIEEELKYLRQINPKYVLFHYPKPVVLDDTVDWSHWRFADSSEYIYQSSYSYDEFKEKSEYLFDWLTNKSEEYNFTPVLEFDALNKYIYKTTLLEELLARYPKLKLCLDTGRLHTQSKLDSNFDVEDIIRRFAKYTEVVHLSNNRVTDKVEYNHYPVLPKLNPKDGWASIDRYLQIIHEENKNCLFLFEHRSDLITDDELNECYEWVESLVSK